MRIPGASPLRSGPRNPGQAPAEEPPGDPAAGMRSTTSPFPRSRAPKYSSSLVGVQRQCTTGLPSPLRPSKRIRRKTPQVRDSTATRPERRAELERLRATKSHSAQSVNTRGTLVSSQPTPPAFAGERAAASAPAVGNAARPASRSRRGTRRAKDHQPRKARVRSAQLASCVMKTTNNEAPDQRAIPTADHYATTRRSAGQGEGAPRGSRVTSSWRGSDAAVIGRSMVLRHSSGPLNVGYTRSLVKYSRLFKRP